MPPYLALGRELRHPTERTLSLLEAECRPHLIEGAPPPMELAYELLEPFPALGVLIARACLDSEHAKDSATLLHEIEWARNRLGAPPDDPAWALWDLMVEERRLAKASDEEKEALRLELERMRAEARDARAEAQVLVRELGKHREQLSELEDKAAEVEKKPASTARERAAQAADAEAARRLRQKIRELEGRIREGQHERAELRRRAEEVAKPVAVEPEETTALEDEAGEEVTPRGLRIPVWSSKARDSIEKLPSKVAGAAIAAAGALGGGRAGGLAPREAARRNARPLLGPRRHPSPAALPHGRGSHPRRGRGRHPRGPRPRARLASLTRSVDPRSTLINIIANQHILSPRLTIGSVARNAIGPLD